MDLLLNFNNQDFHLTMYKHHLDLFHSRRENYNEATVFSRKQVIYYGSQCIDSGLLTREQFEMDMLPRVDIDSLFDNGSKTANIGGDGEE